VGERKKFSLTLTLSHHGSRKKTFLLSKEEIKKMIFRDCHVTSFIAMTFFYVPFPLIEGDQDEG